MSRNTDVAQNNNKALVKQTFSLRLLAVATLGMAHAGVSLAADQIAECGAAGLKVCPQPFDKTLFDPHAMLTWDQDNGVVGFRNTYRLYEGDVFSSKNAKPYPLPPASQALPAIHYSMNGTTYNLDNYLANQSVTGLLILKDGKIAYEYYGKGNTANTLWTSRSVAKSVVSVLVGVAIKEGKIKSVDDKITQYLPGAQGHRLGSGVTLHQLMQHTSGVVWDENYASPDSDFSDMTQCEAKPAPYDCVLNLVKSVKRKPGIKPGEVWSYNTGGAWLVGRVLENATGMTIAKYLERRVWSRYGMQQDGVWHALVKDKVDMGGHGFNASLRDWGRFGQFVLSGGQLPTGEKTPSRTTGSHVRRIGRPPKVRLQRRAPNGQYGYQWWYSAPAPDANAEPKKPPPATRPSGRWASSASPSRSIPQRNW